jgi:phytoene desaturase
MLGKYLKASAYQYEVVMRHFMHANIDSPLDFLSWRMLLAGTKLSAFSTMSAHVRRYFRSPLLQKIMQYQLLFLGSSPFTTPSIYNVMGHVDFNLGVYYPMGGIHRLVEALARIAQKHGAVLKPSAPVERIETTGKRAARLRLASGETVEADIFVSNADVHHTETRLLPPEARAYPPTYWERRQLAPSALIVYLGLKGGADSLLHHNLFFNPEWEKSFAELFDGREWPRHPSYYVCRPSHTDRDVAPDGHETLFALMPISARLGYEADMVRRKADALLGAIEADFGVSDIAARTVLRRDYSGEDFARDYSSLGGSALGLAHTLRQTALFRPANRSRKIENLLYVGAGTNPGIGMPICLISAQLAYKRIAGVRTKAPLASLAPLRGSGRTR